MNRRLVLCLVLVMLSSALPSTISAHEPPSPPQSDIELTGQERAWLAQNPVLKVVTDSDMAPYGFTDEQGRYVGVLPDIASRVGQFLGIRIQFEPVLYDTLVERIRERAADAAALVDPLDVAIEPHYLMTDEVMFMPYGLFVRTDSELAQNTPEIITGKTIALIEGWDLENPSLDSLRNNRFIFADSYLAAVTLVLDGRADAFFDVHASTYYVLELNSIKDIKPIRI